MAENNPSRQPFSETDEVAEGSNGTGHNPALGNPANLKTGLSGEREQFEGLENPLDQTQCREMMENVLAGSILAQEMHVLVQENSTLRNKAKYLEKSLQECKLENAELYSKFGELATEWKKTVEVMKSIHNEEKNDLQKTIKQLQGENREMKKAITELEKLKAQFEEFEKEQRKLRVGQIGFLLETLVSWFIFEGNDRESRRARYGFHLDGAETKVNNMKNTSLQQNAQKRLQRLGKEMSEMFQDWFFDLIKEIKDARIAIAHPKVGSYEEVKAIIQEEFEDDPEKLEDVLVVLDQLNKMYQVMQKPFGSLPA